MKLSNLLNLAQKIGLFTLIYFFSSSSYQAQIVTAENLTNSASADSVNTVCNKDSTFLNSFDTIALATNTLAMSEGKFSVENNFSSLSRKTNSQKITAQFSVLTQEKTLAEVFPLGQFPILIASKRCDSDCPPYPELCTRRWRDKCGGCPECNPNET